MPKLYIIVRTDMASMNAGRTAAQATHAANYFVKMANETLEYMEGVEDHFTRRFKEWQNETDFGCGTVIVLDGGTIQNIKETVDEIALDYLTAIFVDPEYGIKDGNVTHMLKDVPTCAFAFAFEDSVDEYGHKAIRELELYGKTD